MLFVCVYVYCYVCVGFALCVVVLFVLHKKQHKTKHSYTAHCNMYFDFIVILILRCEMSLLHSLFSFSFC